jgi:hypothetical protein
MIKRVIHVIAFAATLVLLSQASAHAQAVRTFVASNGNDAAACSRAAPCRTFAGAVNKTATGGVVSCVDAADYGAVTIAKSLSIVCDNTQAGITTTATGITITTAATDIVTISGLDIEGSGTGINGISFTNGGTLHVHNVRIRGFRGGSVNRSFGINFVPTATARLDVSDSVITDSGFGFGGAGIWVASSGPAISASIWRTKLDNNRIGLRAFGTPTTLNVTAMDTAFTGNSTGIQLGSGNLMLQNVVVANNSLGISNANAGGTLRIGNSAVTGNGIGVQTGTGAFFTSYKNNQIRGNTTDGTPLAAETAE